MFDASFWVAAAFFVFIGLLLKVGYKRVVTLLDARADSISAEIEEAKQLREEAQQLLASYQRKHRDAVKEAEEIIEQAKIEAQRMSSQATASLQSELLQRSQIAKEKIARAEAQVIDEVKEVAVALASRASIQLIQEQLSKEQGQTIIDAAIKELGKKTLQ